MSFLESLAGIFKDAIKINVKIDKRQIDNRKIEIRGNTISMGCQTITDPKKVDEFFDLLARQKDKELLPFDILDKELVDDFLVYEKISTITKDSLDKLKTVLNSEELEVILMARRICLAYQNGSNKLVDDLKRQLEKNYPRKGKRVFNLISTGYFDELIIPFIEIYKSRFPSTYVEEYNKFYQELLKFFPIAIFVGNQTTTDRLESELSKRLEMDIPSIKIHAVGQYNIEKVEAALKKFDLKGLKVNNNQFTTQAGLNGQVVEILLKQNN